MYPLKNLKYQKWHTRCLTTRLTAEYQAGQASCAACLTACSKASYDMLCTYATHTLEAGQVLVTVGRLWTDYRQRGLVMISDGQADCGQRSLVILGSGQGRQWAEGFSDVRQWAGRQWAERFSDVRQWAGRQWAEGFSDFRQWAGQIVGRGI